jgi:cell division protein FtsI (penicillin-binding protein 3)
MDRNGVLLASSVPAPSIWASPEDIDRDPAKLRELARLLEMTPAELNKKLKDEEKTFVWLRRQLDEPIAKQILALGIKGVYDIKEYKRLYPEGEAAAHIVGFTNVEDLGQEGVELVFQKQLAGKPGSRRVIKDRFGRVVEDVGEAVPPVDGQDLQLSIDSKVQFFAYQRLREAVLENKAKAGSVVVLDAKSGEVLALANYPSFNPNQSETQLLALELHYLRDFAAKDIAERSIKEMRRSVPMSAEQENRWMAEMLRVLPDVRRGDRGAVRRLVGEEGDCVVSRYGVGAHGGGSFR